jgi:hypothetical protein
MFAAYGLRTSVATQCGYHVNADVAHAFIATSSAKDHFLVVLIRVRTLYATFFAKLALAILAACVNDTNVIDFISVTAIALQNHCGKKVL